MIFKSLGGSILWYKFLEVLGSIKGGIISWNTIYSCSYYPVSNNSLFICINETSIESNYSCKEEYLFNQFPKGENINCSNYSVINEDNIFINNYNNDDEYDCKE